MGGNVNGLVSDPPPLLPLSPLHPSLIAPLLSAMMRPEMAAARLSAYRRRYIYLY